MAIRKAQALVFRPRTLIDGIDTTNTPPGGLSVAQNLVPSPNNANFFVPRPAATPLISLSSINATGVVSVFAVVGYYVYGMISSTTYPGKDQPFAYNITTSTLQTITGVASGLLPNTLATSGDWVPPVVFSAGSRIMVCHSGFLGGGGNYLGWFDISSFTSAGCFGNTTSGSPILQSMRTNVGNSAPILSGFQPGMVITGTGIPANTTILSMTNGTFSLSATGTTTSGSTSVTSVTPTTGIAAGMTITGPNIATGTYITAYSAGTITLSQNAIATGTASAIVITGGGTVTMSANATATANNVAVTATGGTLASPQWGAGNLNTNPLVTVPTCGASYNGRAWYGAGQYAVYSDPNNPTQVTLASQALTIGDQSPITAMASLPLTAQLTGGIQQSLTIYKGAESFYQITGDAATNNLSQNAVTGSVGTQAPNSIAQTPLGVAMVTVDGVRFLGLGGVQSSRVGAEGSGVLVPFLNALTPSRVAADYAQNIYRISIASSVDPVGAAKEYWYDLTTKQWSGPHTFASNLINAHPSGAGFLCTPLGVNAAIWYSDVIPKGASAYLENGVQLSWVMETTLLPDNEQLAYNAVIETSISLDSQSTDPLQISAIDDTGNLLGSVGILPDVTGASPQWGTAVWGAFTWGSVSGSFRRYAVSWPTPLVFRQAKLRLTGSSDASQLIGDLFVRFQVLGYGLGPSGN